jgi:hypothetical protein
VFWAAALYLCKKIADADVNKSRCIQAPDRFQRRKCGYGVAAANSQQHRSSDSRSEARSLSVGVTAGNLGRQNPHPE